MVVGGVRYSSSYFSVIVVLDWFRGVRHDLINYINVGECFRGVMREKNSSKTKRKPLS